MRRSTGKRHYRPVAREPISEDPVDDLSTWTSTASISTMELPGTTADFYHVVVDVTLVLATAAKADTGGLRFRHENGALMSHHKTAGGRIFLIGNLHGGRNRIDYFWGKAGAVQPGFGFQTAATALADYRLALIFEGGVPVDFSPSPATFTTVGTPTYIADTLGQALQCGAGSYIETTAAKLRGDARSLRSDFAVASIPTATTSGRIICWANWLTGQRAYQLWIRNDGLELYVSSDGAVYQRWELPGFQRAGKNAIGASWQADVAEAVLLLNDVAQVELPAWQGTPPTILHNSTDPYIIGGTKVPDATHVGAVMCQFSRSKPMTPDHFLVWKLAWLEHERFWGIEDRTPNSIDVPDMTNVALSSEVTFARKEVTGISPGTAVSVFGDGSPTYSVGSSFSLPADIKAKGTTAGTVSNGNWIATYHTSQATNSATQESYVTVGTVTSPRRSTTLSATTGGGTGIPEGPATVTVSTLAALKTEFNNAFPGKIIEITPGNYALQGNFDLSNKDFTGQQPVVVRCSTRAYRGYLPTEGGLFISGETTWQTGSGGAEFSYGQLRNLKNVVFDGLRFYRGSASASSYSLDILGCSNLTFRYCKFAGKHPVLANSSPVLESTLVQPYVAYPYWNDVPRGPALWGTGGSHYITFRKCMFHWFNQIALYTPSYTGHLIEDCLFTDQCSDHIYNAAAVNMTIRGCVFYRTWPRGQSGGGISHSDAIQNTIKTQNGGSGHLYDSNIFSVGDGYGDMQPIFIEHDVFPTFLQQHSNTVRNCFIAGTTGNTVYCRPADRFRVENTTIIADLHPNDGAPDSSLNITFNATTGNGRSFGNNTVYRCVTHQGNIGSSAGDTLTQNIALMRTQYATHLQDYSASTSRVLIVDPLKGVLNLTALARWAPKASSPIHPNQTGYHIGSSLLFQNLGILP